MKKKQKEAGFLFLLDGDFTFVLRSIDNFLKQDGNESKQLDISKWEQHKDIKLPTLIITEYEVLLKYPTGRDELYNMCIEQDARLVIIGDSDGLKEVEKVTSKALIAEEIIRPVNAKETSSNLVELLNQTRLIAKRRKILVVDDSPIFLRTAMGWLDPHYNVSICPSAATALQKIDAFAPDLILLDYEMPACSGDKFLEMLRSDDDTKDIPVIFLTSKNDQGTVSKVLSMKPQGYILKTQTKDNILKNISDFFKSVT